MEVREPHPPSAPVAGDVCPATTAVKVALLTPSGHGALAVVAVAGPAAGRIVDHTFTPRSGRPVSSRSDGAICVGHWRTNGGGPGEELVVVRHRADLIEVHCHGGLAAPAAVIESLVNLGAERLLWPEWLARNGESATATEAREALCRAAGPKAARILARQLAGALEREIERIERLNATDDAAAAEAVARLLKAARVGLRLTRPWRVVLVGTVNAGKSSLANALAGHARCLVSPLPGTTRDLVATRLVLEGWELDLVDTAGIRPVTAIGDTERAGIARAEAARTEADLVLHVIPADAFATERPAPPAGEFVVVSKCDLRPKAACPPWCVPTSATTNAGIDDLAARIAAALVPEEQNEPDLLAGAVPFTGRQVDAVTRLRRSPPSSGPGRGA